MHPPLIIISADRRGTESLTGMAHSRSSFPGATPVGHNRVECDEGSGGRCWIRWGLDRTVPWILSVKACEGKEEIPNAPGLVRCIANPVNYRSSAEASLVVPAILTPTAIPSTQPVGNCDTTLQGAQYHLIAVESFVEYREPEDIGGTFVCARWSQTLCIKRALVGDPEWIGDFGEFMYGQIPYIGWAVSIGIFIRDIALKVLTEPHESDNPGYKAQIDAGEIYPQTDSAKLYNISPCVVHNKSLPPPQFTTFDSGEKAGKKYWFDESGDLHFSWIPSYIDYREADEQWGYYEVEINGTPFPPLTAFTEKNMAGDITPKVSRFSIKLQDTYRVRIRRVESTDESREFLREKGVIDFGEVVHNDSVWVYEPFDFGE